MFKVAPPATHVLAWLCKRHGHLTVVDIPATAVRGEAVGWHAHDQNFVRQCKDDRKTRFISAGDHTRPIIRFN